MAPTVAVAALLLALLAGVSLHATGQPVVNAAFKSVDAQLTALANANLFAGLVYMKQGGNNGTVLFAKSYGKMFPEWGIDLPRDPTSVRYQIGSVTRLIVATAVWQQHVRGVLDVNATLDRYLNASDFNISTWCPRVYNQTLGQLQGDCLYPTLAQLMSHQSGFIDTGVHCRFAVGSWQASWCFNGPNGFSFPLNVSSRFALGMYSPLAALTAIEHYKVPLQSAPGGSFQDMTIDDLYLAAALEKVVGKPLPQILDENIFQRLGMSHTYYNVASGNDGVYQNYLPLPGYNAYISPLSVGMYALDFGYIGNRTVRRGDIANTTRDPDGPPYGTFVKFAQNNLGIDSAWVALGGPAAAVVTTFDDMARWYYGITRGYAQLGLNTSTVRRMFTTGTAVGPFFIGQGTITSPFSEAAQADPLGTKYTWYQGNLGYSATYYTEWPVSNDPSRDITIGFVRYTKAILDAFDLVTVNSPSASGGNATDPLNPNNGTTTCMMSVKNYTSGATATADFFPQYGVSGGVPNKDRTAFEYFSAQLAARNSSVASGWVPVPHFHCDTQNGFDQYYMGQLAAIALGHPWMST